VKHFRPCDALSRNLPKEFQIVVANCIAHGRRKFVEVAAKFPEECLYVLGALGKVYQHDAFCREQGISPEERLGYHQAQKRSVNEGAGELVRGAISGTESGAELRLGPSHHLHAESLAKADAVSTPTTGPHSIIMFAKEV
jgi:Transposase IS66 family